MRAVVVQHEKHEGPAMLGPVLEQAGFTLVNRFRQVKREDLDAELVVVLGGPMAVYESDQHPYLNAERAFLAERLAVEAPVLGICLGAQLLAAAAGSEVYKGKNGLELGVGPVRWTPDALRDPAIAGVGPKSVVAHWHGDTFDRVPGAVLLASTDRYSQQAFRLGRSYGLQFHLELTAADLERWIAHDEAQLVADGVDVKAVRAGLGKLRASEAENRAILERLVHQLRPR